MRTPEQTSALYRRDWLSPEKAAARMPIGVTRVYAEIHAGRLKAVNTSDPESKKKHYRIAPEWVDAWIEERLNAA